MTADERSENYGCAIMVVAVVAGIVVVLVVAMLTGNLENL